VKDRGFHGDLHDTRKDDSASNAGYSPIHNFFVTRAALDAVPFTMRLFWAGLSGWIGTIAHGKLSPLDAAISILAALLLLIPLLVAFR